MKPNRFDELAKAMARSVTRRETMKQFGFGLATLTLASLGLATKAEAGSIKKQLWCKTDKDCKKGKFCYFFGPYPPVGTCAPYPSGLGGPCNHTEDCLPGLVCRTYGGIAGGSCGSP